MSVQAMSWVIEKSQHKGSSFVVLLMIANHAHADGSGAYPSFDTLARESRITVRQITNIIPILERSRELTIQRGAGPRGTHLYSINMAQTLLSMEKFSDGNSLAPISTESSEPKLQDKREENHQSACALPVWVPRQEWDEFVEMRKKLRGWTKGAEKHTLDELWNLLNGKCDSGTPQDLRVVLARSVQFGWRGVFEVKNGNGQTGPKTFAEMGTRHSQAAIRRVASNPSTVADDLQRALPERTN